MNYDQPHPSPLLGLLLRLALQHYAQHVEVALGEAGFDDLRPPHASVFPFIGSDGVQVSELAKRARMRKQSMAQAVDQLERLGYVERRLDPRDRRGRLVFLTERGHAIRPVALAAGRQVEERWGQLAGAEQLAALRSSLQHLLAVLAADESGRNPSQ